jgi:hypothetical protein
MQDPVREGRVVSLFRPRRVFERVGRDDQFLVDGWDQRPYVLVGATERRRQIQAVGWSFKKGRRYSHAGPLRFV